MSGGPYFRFRGCWRRSYWHGDRLEPGKGGSIRYRARSAQVAGGHPGAAGAAASRGGPRAGPFAALGLESLALVSCACHRVQEEAGIDPELIGPAC